MHGAMPAVALLLVATSAQNPGCPCLEADLFAGGSFPCGAKKQVVTVAGSPSQALQCYNESYGRGCVAHDAGTSPYCDDPTSQPSFCAASWCYVNTSTCNVSMARSSMLDDAFYSYETCGHEDTWASELITEKLANRTLRAALPGLWHPFAFRYDAEGQIIYTNWSHGDAGVGSPLGIHPEFLYQVAERAGFNIEWVPLSEGSIEDTGGSTWGACVKDVARGHIDVCPMCAAPHAEGSPHSAHSTLPRNTIAFALQPLYHHRDRSRYMYETSARRSETQFTIPLGQDTAYMVIPKPSFDNSLISELTKVFDPFARSTWFLIFGMTLLTGLVHALLSPDVELPSMTRASRASMAKGLTMEAATAKAKRDRFVRGIHRIARTSADGVYTAFGEFVSGAPMFDGGNDDLTWPRRAITVSWGAFLLVVIAAYTANMAAFLGNRKADIPFGNVEECIEGGCDFCHNNYGLVVQAFEVFHPDLDAGGHLKDADSTWKIWQGLGNSTDSKRSSTYARTDHCDAGFEFDMVYRFDPKYTAEDAGCNVNIVGSSLFTIDFAWPVSNAVAPSINYFIRQLLTEGAWNELLLKYEPKQTCGDWRVDKSALEADEMQPLKPASLFGPTFLLVLALLGGCVSRLCALGTKGAARKIQKRKMSSRPELRRPDKIPSADAVPSTATVVGLRNRQVSFDGTKEEEPPTSDAHVSGASAAEIQKQLAEVVRTEVAKAVREELASHNSAGEVQVQGQRVHRA